MYTLNLDNIGAHSKFWVYEGRKRHVFRTCGIKEDNYLYMVWKGAINVVPDVVKVYWTLLS